MRRTFADSESALALASDMARIRPYAFVENGPTVKCFMAIT